MNMKTRRIIIGALGLALFAALLAAVPAAAQTDITTGRFVGQVVDHDGQPLPGASVEAKNKGTGLALTAVTDARGTYRIVNAPVGAYDVTANLSGFQKRTRGPITITIGSALTVDFTLTLAGVTETVTVAAEAPVIETTQTATQNTVENAAIQALPVSGRNFTDFVLLTPGAQRETQRGNLSLGGGRGINTMVTVDGVDSTNAFFGGVSGSAEGRSPISISQEAVREFQVVQAGASAEYGRSSGGFVNVITKGGSNDFKGSAFYYYRPSNWSAKLANGTDPRDSKKDNLGASLGGPVLKDRLFFFGSYERQRMNTTIPISSVVQRDEAVIVAKFPSYPTSGTDFTQTADADTYFGRLDLQANDQQRIALRSNYTKYIGESGTGTTTSWSTAHNGLEGMKSLTNVLQWNGMFGSSLINDLNVQYVKEDTPRENMPAGLGLPEIQVFGGGSTLGGVSYLPITASQKRYTIYDSVTYLMGSHVVKGGAEYNYTSMDQVFKGNWRGVFIFNDTANGQKAFQNFQNGKWNEYREFLGLNGLSADEAGKYDYPQKEYAFFLQDQWFVTRKLTVTLGVRWENQLNPSDPVLDANKLKNPASGVIQPDVAMPNQKNMWSPRLSVAYSPDTKTVVRFSAGRYWSRFPAILTSQLYTSNGVRGSSLSLGGRGVTGARPGDPGWGASWDPTRIQQLGNLPAGAVLPAPGVFSIDPNFENAHTDLGVLGLEREFLGLSWGVEGQYSKTANLERTNDINLLASTNPAVDCPNLSPTSGVTCYGLNGKTNRPNTAYTTVKVYTSDARAEYWGVTLKVRKNFANGMRFFGAVTRATDKDTDSNERNYSGLMMEDLGNPEQSWGYSDRDIKWRFVANATYDFKITSFLDGLAGVLFNYQTGRPFTPTSGQDLNLDGNNNDRPTVNGAHLDRNSYRYPDFYTLDLRVGVAFGLGPGRLSILGECYNCTNTANRGLSNSQYGIGPNPSSSFALLNTVTSFPRQLQAAVRYDF